MSEETPVTGQVSANTGVGAAETAAAPAASTTAPWYGQLDDATVGYIQNKGWQNVNDVLNSYRGAEKFMSAPVDRRVVIPGDSTDAQGWNDLYTKLGRPSNPEGYQLAVPEKYGDPEFAKKASTWFHELGLSSAQGKGVSDKFNSYISELVQGQETERQAKFEADVADLRKTWGLAHDQNTVIAANAARALDMSKEAIDAISGAIGHKATMELLHKFGSKLGEGEFLTGKSEGAALTPEAAKARIQDLMRDKDWAAKYMKGDVGAKNEMLRLHSFAYPENR